MLAISASYVSWYSLPLALCAWLRCFALRLVYQGESKRLEFKDAFNQESPKYYNLKKNFILLHMPARKYAYRTVVVVVMGENADLFI